MRVCEECGGQWILHYGIVILSTKASLAPPTCPLKLETQFSRVKPDWRCGQVLLRLVP